MAVSQTTEQAFVTLYGDASRVKTGPYDLADLTWESALAAATKAVESHSDLRSVWVEVPGEYAEWKAVWRFTRDDLMPGGAS
jgi:hypothetical protein